MPVTFVTMVRHNLARNRLRSVLLIVCIATAFLIFGLLCSFRQGFEGSEATAERLVVTNKVSTSEELPLAYATRLAAMPGIAAATPITRLRAYAVHEYNIIGANAVDPASYLKIYASTYDFTPALAHAFTERRTAALVGRSLAELEGWQVGQRITLTSFIHTNADGSNDWPFEVAGIFDGREPTIDTSFLIVREDFFNEAVRDRRDMTNMIGVLPAAGADTNALAQQIDGAFANSSAETRTRSETEFMSAFLEQFANVALIVRLVVGTAFLTILMIVANTMIFSIRERRLEIGVLKVLGFNRAHVIGVVLAETTTLFGLGLALGLGLTALAVRALAAPLSSVVPQLNLTPAIAADAGGFALIFALLTGLIPAIQAVRLPAAVALRSR